MTARNNLGLSKTREYVAWQGMLKRCNNPRNKRFARYGGRGIKVCDAWLEFKQFLSDMGKCPDGYSIDRIDNDGNYEPSNCRWATRQQQQRNTRQNRYLTLAGKTMTIAEWVESTGIPRDTIAQRLALGWSDERTLTEPVRKALPKVEATQ